MHWIVYDYSGEAKRRVYTFDNATAAHDLVEFILRNDFMSSELRVEEYEVATQL